MKKIFFTIWFLSAQLSNYLSQTNSNRSPEELKTLLQKSKPDSNRVNLLLQLGDFYLSAFKQTPTAIDSALVYAQQADKLSQSLNYNSANGNSSLLLSKIWEKKQDPKKGTDYALKAIAIFSKYGPEKKMADSYVTLGYTFDSYESGLPEMMRLIELATNIYHKEKDKENEATSLLLWGNFLMCHGEPEKGLVKLKQSLALYQSIKHLQLQAVYALIGINYSMAGNYEEALKYGLLSVKTVEDMKDNSKEAAQFYIFLANTYEGMGQLGRMDDYHKKALAIVKKRKYKGLHFSLVFNISRRLLSQNKAPEVLVLIDDLLKSYQSQNSTLQNVDINYLYVKTYLQLKDYKNASVYCSMLLATLDKCQPDDPNKRVIYPAICSYFFETAQFDKALFYLPGYKTYCERSGFLPSLRNAHLAWFRVDSAQGNYLSAIEHYKLYKTLNDSLFNENKSKQLSKLQIQYDTEKKDKDLQLQHQNIQILTEQALVHKTKLNEANILRNVMFGGATLLGIIVVLLFNRSRLKRRTYNQLEIQQKEIYEKNISLQHLVNEKEWLLKEVHHRVKNNLQTVMSLLNTQSAYLVNNEALDAIQNSQHRVQAMSLIHQKLYRTTNFSTIEMPVYIQELIEYLKQFFTTRQRIRFELQIAPLELDISQAVSVGLILNEAITNSLKYAFPEERSGLIKIEIHLTSPQNYLLTISDNGVGLPVNFNTNKYDSLGLSLMEGLSQDLGGSFTIKNNSGTTITISFVLNSNTKKV